MASLFNVRRIAAAAAVAGCLAGAGLYAQQELVMEPLKDAGLNVYPAEDPMCHLLLRKYFRAAPEARPTTLRRGECTRALLSLSLPQSPNGYHHLREWRQPSF
jgi:hypothetical protein